MASTLPAPPQPLPDLTKYDPNGGQPCNTYVLRPMRLADIPSLAQQNAKGYWRTPVNDFLSPRASQYPHHLIRTLRRAITRRYLQPNVLSLVVCLAEIPDIAVGYGQFARVGTDSGARAFLSSRPLPSRLWLWFLSWLFFFYTFLESKISPDLATSTTNLATFYGWVNGDIAKHWGPQHSSRQNRWIAQSILIDPPYQGKGLGKLLVKEVLRRAQEEGVVVGLSASMHGEFMYKKLGFELLGGFGGRVPGAGPETGGGIMIWFPEGWKGPRTEEEAE